MTKTQTATLAKLRELTANGPLDVTYGGIKGVNRTALWSLEKSGHITVNRTYAEDPAGVYDPQLVSMFVTVN